MSDFNSAFDSLSQWAVSAHRSGWLQQQDLDRLDQIEQQQSSALFDQIEHRPLIVGLFGGTGVGKSSLLNRLAGQEIARSGVERPTSIEVTLFLHQDFQIDLLPDELPLEQTRIAYHNQSGRRLLAWLDMPDMDSTEQRNRELVEAWLPYLDWVVYVVSPERYHDDIGWRFLQQRGKHHAWIFVMNHWDQGTQAQFDDFKERLISEGFSYPTVLATSCANGNGDDFDALEQTIRNAIDDYGIDLLRTLGIEARLLGLSEQIDSFYKQFADDNQWKQAKAVWQSTLNDSLTKLTTHLQDHAESLVSLFRAQKKTDEPLSDQFKSTLNSIWSAREQDKTKQLDLRLLNGLQSENLPVKPFQTALDKQLSEVGVTIREVMEQALFDSIAKPGNIFHRGLYQLSGWLKYLLPLSVAGWAGYHAVSTYYQAIQGQASFLNIDFAAHSLLLIALAWLLPWLLHRQLKPTPALILKRGLKTGINRGVGELKEHYEKLWNRLMDEKGAQLDNLSRSATLARQNQQREMEGLHGSFQPQQKRD